MSEPLLNLSEIFVSVQGEGSLLGQPSIFLRTSGCNLRCRWGTTRCDTDFASWNPEQNLLSLQEVLTRTRKALAEYPAIRHMVVTGGEPALQPALPGLLQALHADGLHITLETNGTCILPRVPIDLVSLSPKLSSSTPLGTEHEAAHNATRLQPDALRFWVQNYNYQLKFVVFQDGDEEEIRAILKEIGPVEPQRVFLMPEGVSLKPLREHAQGCVRMALRNGWRFTPRAHIEIFGNQRGT